MSGELASTLWESYGSLLQRIFGAYYEPEMRGWFALWLFFSIVGVHGLITGIEGAMPVLVIFTALTAFGTYNIVREDRRWRAETPEQ